MQKRRKEVIQAVINEQHRQKRHGNWDIERIRTVSVDSSSWAVSRALKIGNDDAEEVGCPPSSLFLYGSMFDGDFFPMDVDDISTSAPSVCGLSYDSMSSTSEGTDDLSWAEKLMGEDLIPEL